MTNHIFLHTHTYNTVALIHNNERDQQLNTANTSVNTHLLDIPLFSRFFSILKLFSISKNK